jgi:hypothetical protein
MDFSRLWLLLAAARVLGAGQGAARRFSVFAAAPDEDKHLAITAHPEAAAGRMKKRSRVSRAFLPGRLKPAARTWL